ncbi:ATP-binding protein [Streptomyces mobaraensis]|uniref:ATP-binding protein n=1 Tax=Streptomyces mobaraensis TaxID=35621 RepID=UPI00331AA51B
MMPITEAVSLGLAAGTATAAVIAAPLLIRVRRLNARLREELAAATEYGSRLADRQRAWSDELERLVDVRLPAVLEGVPEADVPKPLYGVPEGDPESAALAARHEALLSRTAAAIRTRKDREESGRAAFLVMADRIQVMALAQQQGLDVLEQSAEDPVLMAGLMRADHAAAQLARQAQTMKVLCGAWPGRQWPDAVSLLDVVRGAQSRILEYQRVRVQGARDAAVEPRAVEALIHAVAELLDNATRYSPPTVTVLVGIRPVHSGAVIEIDDGGLGMTEQALAEAEVRLGGGAAAQGRGLGAKPQLGLAAVGMLARRYGFSVKLDSPSAYGGVRAVVLVPSALLTQGPTTPATPAPPRAPGLREQAEREQAERRRARRDAHGYAPGAGTATPADAAVPSASAAPAASSADAAPEWDAPREHMLPEAMPRQGGSGGAEVRDGYDAGVPGGYAAGARDGYAARAVAGPETDGAAGHGTDSRHPGVPAAGAAETAPMTRGGLPRRRSRRVAGPAHAHEPSQGPAPRRSAASASVARGPEPVRSPQQAAAFMSSLQAGTRLGREEAAEAVAGSGAGGSAQAAVGTPVDGPSSRVSETETAGVIPAEVPPQASPAAPATASAQAVAGGEVEATPASRTPQATMAAEATDPVGPSDAAAVEGAAVRAGADSALSADADASADTCASAEVDASAGTDASPNGVRSESSAGAWALDDPTGRTGLPLPGHAGSSERAGSSADSSGHTGSPAPVDSSGHDAPSDADGSADAAGLPGYTELPDAGGSSGHGAPSDADGPLEPVGPADPAELPDSAGLLGTAEQPNSAGLPGTVAQPDSAGLPDTVGSADPARSTTPARPAEAAAPVGRVRSADPADATDPADVEAEAAEPARPREPNDSERESR